MNASFSPAAWIRQRLEHRADSEHEQAVVRLAVLSVVLIYMLVRRAAGSDENDASVTIVLAMVATGLRRRVAAGPPPFATY